MKNKLIALLKSTVTVLLFYLLFRKVDFQQFGATLRNARLEILAASFLMLWAGHYICIFRWRILMRPLMPVYPFSHLLGIYCIGLFFNLTFPTAVGGDVVKMYYAGKPSKLYAQSFAATFLDRDSGMFAMMIIACVGVLVHPVRLPRIPVAFIIWFSFAAFILLNVIVFAPRLHRRFTTLLRAVRLGSIAAKVDAISRAFETIGKHWPVLASSLAISLVNQTLVIAYAWVLAQGLNIRLSLLYYLVFIPIITLISMIPVSLNGMGLREYAFVSLFSGVGLPPASCMAMGLLTSVSLVLSAIPGGVIYVFFRDRHDVEQMAALESEFS
jgi:uncharacterized protein (TIRG00374 family)